MYSLGILLNIFEFMYAYMLTFLHKAHFSISLKQQTLHKACEGDGTDFNNINWKVEVSSVKPTSNYAKTCNVYFYVSLS